jgi:hypothetical protein
MTIHFNKSTSVGAFQSVFNAHYPFLKLVFFRHQNKEEDIWASPMVISNRILLGELSDILPNKWDAQFTASPNMTIAEFEDTLQNKFNLAIRIFKKDMGDWIETIDCRHLDLEGANELAALRNHTIEDVIL